MSDEGHAQRELIIRLHDKLDEHMRETRDRDEKREAADRGRWDRYQEDRRDHQIEHGKLSSWQVDVNKSMRQGAIKMVSHDEQLQKISPTWARVLSLVGGSLLVAAAVVGWFYTQLDAKADKADVAHLNQKMEKVGITLKGVADKLGIPTQKEE